LQLYLWVGASHRAAKPAFVQLTRHTALLCGLAPDFAHLILDTVTEILRTYPILPMRKQPAHRLAAH